MYCRKPSIPGIVLSKILQEDEAKRLARPTLSAALREMLTPYEMTESMLLLTWEQQSPTPPYTDIQIGSLLEHYKLFDSPRNDRREQPLQADIFTCVTTHTFSKAVRSGRAVRH